MVIPDGRLHLVPFDGLMDTTDHYIVEEHTVTYAPSATSFYVLATQKLEPHRFAHTLLAAGGFLQVERAEAGQPHARL